MPPPAIHPGEHLAEEVELPGSARKIDVPANGVTQILNGTCASTGDTALRLAPFFGTSAESWPNLQCRDALRLAQGEAGKSIKALSRLKPTDFIHS